MAFMNKDANKIKFNVLRNYRLPIRHFAITGSGPLGIRNLRPIGDIDLLVSDVLWKDLASAYEVREENDETKIVFPDGIISAYREGSFSSFIEMPSVAKRIAEAEIIEGLPFEALQYVILFKKMWGREKDLEDLQLIEAWQKKTSHA